MNSNTILSTFLNVEEAKNKNNGERYFILHLLLGNQSCKLYFKDLDLFNQFKTLSRVTDIVLNVEIILKNDATFTLKPLAFEK
ncbi:MAG: hypothetical protein RR290_02380 [Clostridia bacterium]